MKANVFLCTTKMEELEKSTVVALERVTILDFQQIVAHQVIPGQTLTYFKQPDIRAYPLHLDTKSFMSKQEVSQVDCMSIIEKYVIEEDIHNVNHDGNADKRLKVITRRHVLMRILTAPFFKVELPVIVMRHKHIIYMSLLKAYYPDTSHGKQYYEFAEYCETNFAQANTTNFDSMQEKNKGYFIFGAKFGELDLIYTAEENSVMSDTPIEDLRNMDTLNNTRFISVNVMDAKKYAYWTQTTTAFKWWCKAYLSNIKDFFIGFKNANGVINQLPLLKHITFLEKAQQQRIHVSNAFLHKFLNLVVDSTKSYDSPETIIKYSFDMQGNVSYSVHNASEFPMFSAEFTAYLQKQAN